MNNKEGFSRAEVIVILMIAVFTMAILMPAGAELRESSREAACAMNMRQLGICFDMYTRDNNGYFTDGQRSPGSPSGIGDWLTALAYGFISEKDWLSMSPVEDELYGEICRAGSYIKDLELLVCPMAPTPSPWDGDIPVKFRAWGGGDGYENMSVYLPLNPDAIGGYTHNNWCNDFPIGEPRWEYNPAYCWRTTEIEGAAMVPVLMDSYRWGCNPQAEDTPPEYDGGPGGAASNEMSRICIDRHNGAINILFMDWSVRRVGLKQLWDIDTRWHRNWVDEWNDNQVDQMPWPDWMKDF